MSGAPRRSRPGVGRLRAAAVPVLVLGCVLAAACGTEGEGSGTGEEPRPTRSEAAPAPGATEDEPRSTDPTAPARGGPEEEAPVYPCMGGSVEAGAPLYREHCASCHGPEGDGEGPSAAGLNPKPVHLDDGAYMNRLSNAYLRRITAEGGAAVGKSSMMPGLEATLSEAEIRDVVAFVRSLAEPAYRCPREGPAEAPSVEEPSAEAPEGGAAPASRTPEARKSGRPPG